MLESIGFFTVLIALIVVIFVALCATYAVICEGYYTILVWPCAILWGAAYFFWWVLNNGA